MAVEHANAELSKKAFLEQFNDAFEEGRWLAVVVTSTGTGLNVRRTTSDFPPEYIEAALEKVARNLDNERGGSKPGRLQLAPHIAPNDNGADNDPVTDAVRRSAFDGSVSDPSVYTPPEPVDNVASENDEKTD